MDVYEVRSLKDRVIININKSLVSKENLLRLLNRLQVENLAQKSDFDEKIMDVGREIKSNWWKENKEAFLVE